MSAVVIITTDPAIPQAQMTVDLGHGVEAAASACKATGYIDLRHSAAGVYAHIGCDADVHLAVLRCLLATGGVTRQDVETLLDEEAAVPPTHAHALDDDEAPF